jgi:hypothetical protein
MHNSLTIREQLRKANRQEKFTRFRDPYRAMTIGPGTPSEGEMAVDGSWRLSIDGNMSPEAADALRMDLEALWLKLGLTLEADSASADSMLELTLSENLAARGASIEIQPGKIALEGGDAAGLWAAVMWLSWELRVRRAAVLRTGQRSYSASWGLQISQGPLGGNYSVPDLGPEFLSDASLRLYAHSAVNSMMIYGDILCYAKSKILPELNHPDADRHLEIMVDAGQRAAVYGLGFTYVPVHPKLSPGHAVFQAHPQVRGRGYDAHGYRYDILCSSQKDSLAFYAEQYERLFSAVPQLQAVLAITYSESFYHCDMHNSQMVKPCQNCQSLQRDQRVIPLLTAVEKAITRANPKAFLAEWIYSYGTRESGGRTLPEILTSRPERIHICQSVDKDALYDGACVYQKPGYRKSPWDYCLDLDEPTIYAKQASTFAQEKGRFFVAKTETGIGIETMQLPYVPALPHLARKWEGVRSLKPDAVHQAWLFYGHHFSRAERLAAWAAYRPEQPREEYLRELARADFGSAAEGVLKCWSRFSLAVKHLPCVHLGLYYRSPSFFGPCYPFLPCRTDPVPDLFHVCLYYLQEHGLTFLPRQIEECRVPMTVDFLQHLPIIADPGLSWELVIEEYAHAAREGRLGWEALAAVENELDSESDRLNWMEEMALAELTWRSFLTCEHAVRFLCARKRLETDEDHDALAEMLSAARLERDNAIAAAPLYQAAPWLDPSARIDGIFPATADCIAEKCRIIDTFIESNTEQEIREKK